MAGVAKLATQKLGPGLQLNFFFQILVYVAEELVDPIGGQQDSNFVGILGVA